MANTTMQAVFITPTENGGVYEYRDVEKPQPNENQVLVLIKAAGINRGDVLIKKIYNSANPMFKPALAGIEYAGEIAAVGSNVSDWKIGDKVMGWGFGGYAQYTLATVNEAASLSEKIGYSSASDMPIVKIPSSLSFAEAGALLNVFITSHDALVSNADIQAGNTVLITAGSSGIGSASIQLAKYFGAKTVFATTRDAKKAPALKDLGADIVIDTAKEDYTKDLLEHTDGRGVDIIVDSVGGPMFNANLEMLAVKGRLIQVGRNAGNVTEPVNLDDISRKRVQIIGTTFRTRTNSETRTCFNRFVEDCMEGFDDGSLRPIVDKTFPFSELHAAHNYVENNEQVGKVVLCSEQ